MNEMARWLTGSMNDENFMKKQTVLFELTMVILEQGVSSGVALPFSLGGGGGLRDAKPYFTDRNSFFTLKFCYKFNSTDAFPDSWQMCTPPTPRTLRPWV